MFFAAHEIRQRHAAIDRAVDGFRSFLDTNDAEKGALAPEKTRLYRSSLDHLVVPNIRFGVMHMSKQALRDENYIPVWSLSPGEKLIQKNYIEPPMPQQQECIAGLVETTNWREHTNEINHSLAGWYSSKPSEYPLEIKDHHNALLWSTQYKIHTSDGSYRYITGRPTLLLNYSEKLISHRPDVLAHEIEHIKQSVDRPLRHHQTVGDRDDDALNEELIAYRAQKRALDELYRQGRADEDLCALDQIMLGHIDEATADEHYDAAGNFRLNEQSRRAIIRKLADYTYIAPGLDRSNLDRAERLGALISRFPAPRAPVQAANTAQ